MKTKIIKAFAAIGAIFVTLTMTACKSNNYIRPVHTSEFSQSQESFQSSAPANDNISRTKSSEETKTKSSTKQAENSTDDRALYEAFLKTDSWRNSVAQRVDTASEYTYDYNNFKCGKYYYDLDGDGRLELFICLSYQRDNLQYSFPYILDINNNTVFCAYEFQATCPTRFSNHITLLQGTDKNYYFVIDSNDGGIYDAAGKYLYAERKLIHVDSVHAYNTTGSLESSYPSMYYISDGADLYLDNVIKDWKYGAGNGVKNVDKETYEAHKEALYKGTEIIYYYS